MMPEVYEAVWGDVTDLRPSSALCVEFERCTTLVALVTLAVPDHLEAHKTLSLLVLEAPD